MRCLWGICTLVIWLILCPMSSRAQDDTSVLNKRYSFDIPPVSLIEVLGLVRSHTGARFIYSPSNLPSDQLVSVSARDKALRDILDDLLDPIGVEYEVIAGQIALRVQQREQRKAYSQTIRGKVVDRDTQSPLIGAHVFIETTSTLRGATTDEDGQFEIPELPLGRHVLAVQYIGFTPIRIAELLLTAGKEIVLDVEMVSLPLSMDQITISEEVDLSLPLNEMAVVSARSFSVEQTQRFAASLSDPARMAQSFAGVSRSEDDVLNEVIVRGHSPKYTAWYLEGIEVPNPNHFSDDGHSSGGISVLSSNMVTYSDFYTGAFPAQYGNALAGVFDINIRRGNTSRREHTLSIGALGVEGTIEGPFSSDYNGSYLVNYRYSTLGLLTDLNFIDQGQISYQDLAFKVHLPTKKAGVFSLFGIGGLARETDRAVRDSSQWNGNAFNSDEWLREERGLIGLNYTHIFSSSAYLRTTVALFSKTEQERFFVVRPEFNYDRYFADEEISIEEGVRGHISVQFKPNVRHLLQMGLRGNIQWYSYLFQERISIPGPWFQTLDTSGRAVTWSSYAQWSYRPTVAWKYHLGVHVSGYSLNRETTIEPRGGITWQLSEKHRLALASGLYSQIESPGLYSLERVVNGVTYQPNRSLRKSKSWHNVSEYEYTVSPNMRFKAEIYYNRGYDTPVSDAPGSSFSVINTYYLYDVVTGSPRLVNTGTTTNYGIDLTVEKFFSGGYYFLLTGSRFESNYTANNGRRYPGRYATKYMTKLTNGWEFKIGSKKNQVLGINTRILFGGGNRYTPLVPDLDLLMSDEIASLIAPFTEQLSPYFRIDTGINYTINRPYLTHNLFLDVQNVTDRINEGYIFYDRRLNQADITYQLGILPVLGYKLTF